jgi:N,N'-diacetyllegionaminate synthase
VSKTLGQAAYQTTNTGKSESQFEMLSRLELPFEDFVVLKSHCDERKIMFMSTPDDLESAYFLSGLQRVFKIGSGNITDLQLLEYVAGLGKDIILSSGMATMDEIESAIKVLKAHISNRNTITILHCTTDYPASMLDVNLRAMQTIAQSFDVPVGYSDHTLGIEVAICAVALGATVIEKHFTLDVNLPGPDHKASLNPDQLVDMVRSIRNIESALGDGQKKPTENELLLREVVRKSIVASRPIREGEVFTTENLTAKRAGAGISPMRLQQILGQTANKYYLEDEMITE